MDLRIKEVINTRLPYLNLPMPHLVHMLKDASNNAQDS